MELSNLMYPDPTVPLSNVTAWLCSQETDSALSGRKGNQKRLTWKLLCISQYFGIAKIPLRNMHPLKQYLNNHNNLSLRMCQLAGVALLFVTELILESLGWWQLGFLDLVGAQLGSSDFQLQLCALARKLSGLTRHVLLMASEIERACCIKQVYLKPLLSSCLLISQQPKRVTRPNPRPVEGKTISPKGLAGGVERFEQ